MGWSGVGGGKMVRMGDGVENSHKRRAYERSSISHVNNIHLEYANSAHNTHRIYSRPSVHLNLETKGPRGIVQALVSMRVHTVSLCI